MLKLEEVVREFRTEIETQSERKHILVTEENAA